VPDLLVRYGSEDPEPYQNVMDPDHCDLIYLIVLGGNKRKVRPSRRLREHITAQKGSTETKRGKTASAPRHFRCTTCSKKFRFRSVLGKIYSDPAYHRFGNQKPLF
jgi:hypothetical protein